MSARARQRERCSRARERERRAPKLLARDQRRLAGRATLLAAATLGLVPGALPRRTVFELPRRLDRPVAVSVSAQRVFERLHLLHRRFPVDCRVSHRLERVLEVLLRLLRRSLLALLKPRAPVARRRGQPVAGRTAPRTAARGATRRGGRGGPAGGRRVGAGARRRGTCSQDHHARAGVLASIAASYVRLAPCMVPAVPGRGRGSVRELRCWWVGGVGVV